MQDALSQIMKEDTRTVVLMKICTSRPAAQTAKRSIISVGFDALMHGNKVEARIPAYEVGLIEVLTRTQWMVAA